MEKLSKIQQQVLNDVRAAGHGTYGALHKKAIEKLVRVGLVTMHTEWIIKKKKTSGGQYWGTQIHVTPTGRHRPELERTPEMM